MNRRSFLRFTAAGVATALSARWMPLPGARKVRIEAVAFDAFPILDPRSVVALAERLFPGRGVALGDAWRTRQFEYQWLRALSSRYASFWQATEDSLEFAAELLQLELTPEKRKRLMDAHLELEAWPDAARALKALRQSGMRLAILSNATPSILAAGVARSGLGSLFEHVLSTDAIRTFKPDPGAYRMAPEAFRLPPQAILYVAFAGWDAAGAKWFGFPTYWVNRANLPPERLGVQPDGTGGNLTDLVAFVRALGTGAR
ncbi:MAG TPA: haloacid dehalogenase type II [Candidatus Polarisedimenticolaceae bacterium]|nr:haloacid dehalogenase type II [Candidatus Polarisedimenticolaceae bacterium]